MNLYRNCHIVKIMKVRESKAQTSLIAITYHKCSKYSIYIYVYISACIAELCLTFRLNIKSEPVELNIENAFILLTILGFMENAM